MSNKFSVCLSMLVIIKQRALNAPELLCNAYVSAISNSLPNKAET
jgi:hypothetical protein